MGRKPTKSGPLIAVSVDGRGAAWCDGQFSGDPEVVSMAKIALSTKLPVEVFGQELLAEPDTPVGIAAALFAYSPGRTVIVEAPDEVIDTLAAGMAWDHPERMED